MMYLSNRCRVYGGTWSIGLQQIFIRGVTTCGALPKMPKSRKTKSKHQDFQKVKLKAGKPLPRGLNETATTFKTRTIQIREQLATDTTQPTTKRRLNIKDLLSQCQHYSLAIRLDALSGIRELITSSPDLLDSHLSSIFERTSSLCLDKDGQLRGAVCRLYKFIMPLVSSSQMKPFFPLLSAHLGCAMTHIQDDVQVDSLELLDICLDHYPELVTEQRATLLPNFIRQISRQSGGGKGSGSRTLVVNPNAKISGQRWRHLVLKRLHKFLSAILMAPVLSLEYSRKPKSISYLLMPCRHSSPGHQQLRTLAFLVHKKSESSQVQTIEEMKDGQSAENQSGARWDWSRPTEVLIMSDPQVTGLCIKSDFNSTKPASGTQSSLRDYMITLIPILLQSWVEVGPSQLATDLPGNALGADAMTTLSSILGILQLLMESLGQHDDSQDASWLREKYLGDFQQYFLPFFPYAMHEPMQRKKDKNKGKQGPPQISALTLNLAVCDVMTWFVDKENISSLKYVEVIQEYLGQTIRQTKLSLAQTEVALKVLQRLLALPLHADVHCDLLVAALKLYNEQHDLSAEKEKIMYFFAAILQDQKRSALHRLPPMEQWLGLLPRQLCRIRNEDVARRLLHTMRTLAVMGHPAYIQSLQAASLSIMKDFLPHAQLPSQQIGVLQLLFWLPHWTPEHFQAIVSLSRVGTLDVEAIKHFLQIAAYRICDASLSGKVSAFDPSAYLSLLMSLCRGPTLSPQLGSPVNSGPGQPPSQFHWKRHTFIVQEVVSCLRMFPNANQVARLYCTFIEAWMKQERMISMHMLYGIMKCVQSMSDIYQPSPALLVTLCTLILRELRLFLIELSCIQSRTAAEDQPASNNQESGNEIDDCITDMYDCVAEVFQNCPLHKYIAEGACRNILETTFCAQTMSDTQQFVSFLCRILQHPKLETKSHSYKVVIEPVVEAAQVSHPELADFNWWIGFRYDLAVK